MAAPILSKPISIAWGTPATDLWLTVTADDVARIYAGDHPLRGVT